MSAAAGGKRKAPAADTGTKQQSGHVSASDGVGPDPKRQHAVAGGGGAAAAAATAAALAGPGTSVALSSSPFGADPPVSVFDDAQRAAVEALRGLAVPPRPAAAGGGFWLRRSIAEALVARAIAVDTFIAGARTSAASVDSDSSSDSSSSVLEHATRWLDVPCDATAFELPRAGRGLDDPIAFQQRLVAWRAECDVAAVTVAPAAAAGPPGDHSALQLGAHLFAAFANSRNDGGAAGPDAVRAAVDRWVLKALLCVRFGGGTVLHLNGLYGHEVLPVAIHADDDNRAEDLPLFGVRRVLPLHYAHARAMTVAMALLELPAAYGLNVNAVGYRNETALQKALRHSLYTPPIRLAFLDAVLARASDDALNTRVAYVVWECPDSELDDNGDPWPVPAGTGVHAGPIHGLPALRALVLQIVPREPYVGFDDTRGVPMYAERLCSPAVSRDDGTGYDLFARWTRPTGSGIHSSGTPRTARELAQFYLQPKDRYPLADSLQQRLTAVADLIAAAEQRVIAHAQSLRAAVTGALGQAATPGPAAAARSGIPAPVLDIVFAYALRRPYPPA